MICHSSLQSPSFMTSSKEIVMVVSAAQNAVNAALIGPPVSPKLSRSDEEGSRLPKMED
jgi:hypothetical protein